MALTANIGSQLKMKFGTIQAYMLGVGAQVYRGALTCARLTTGYAHPALRDTADDYKQVFIGIAQEEKLGTDAGVSVRLRLDGKFKVAFTGGTPIVGTLACIYDDETVQAYSGTESNVVVGRITESLNSGTYVYVDLLDRPSRVANGQYE